ncbi:hypothetical protein ACFXGT_37435 [Streptomyces sp. NPDC059352]|uniref:hypothetical protein n=1 Tax=Streptomyces sp. NPDC059352 TaxID=3346810 RepID=UPI0036A0C4BC
MTSRNTTHQQRIAKDLNARLGCGYQESLRRVREAAAVGRLPATLDAQGRAAAVEFLVREAVFAAGRATTPARGLASAPPWCLWSWSGAAQLASLAPGTVTGLVSLPTAGRSTLALSIALHNAMQGIGTLFTSGEITGKDLGQKIIAARYGFDARHQEPPGGWEAFKVTAVPERDAMPLLRHGARAGSSARDSLRAGLLTAARADRTVRLWVVDSLWHFSDLTDEGVDTASAMAGLRLLAREHQLAVLVTSQVLTTDPEDPDEPVTAAHLPDGMTAYSDQVLVLDRPGTDEPQRADAYPTAATLRRVSGPAPAIALELQPENCRFVLA